MTDQQLSEHAHATFEYFADAHRTGASLLRSDEDGKPGMMLLITWFPENPTRGRHCEITDTGVMHSFNYYPRATNRLSRRGRGLSLDQIELLIKALNRLPKGEFEGPIQRRVLVSFRKRSGWVTYSYDRRKLPSKLLSLVADLRFDVPIHLPKLSPRATFQPQSGRITTVAMVPGQKLFVSGGWGKHATLWEPSGEQKMKFVSSGVDCHCVAVSQNGDLLATGSSDGAIDLWELNTGRCLWSFAEDDEVPPVLDLTFSPSGKLLAVTNETGTVLWDVESKAVAKSFAGGRAVRFSSSERLLAVLGFHHLTVWNLNAGQKLFNAKASENAEEFCCLEFSPNDRKLVTGPDRGGFTLWDVRKGMESRTIKPYGGQTGTKMAFSPDRKSLAVATLENQFYLCEYRSGAPTALLAGHLQPVVSLAFSTDGETLVSADDSEIKIWDLNVDRE